MRLVTLVCSGNLCRSPVAETLLRKHLQTLGVQDVLVQSAGTIARPGMRAAGEARRAAELLGGDLSKHRARSLDRATLEDSHLVLCAAAEHILEIRRRWSEVNPDKLCLFTEPIEDAAGEDVDDPYGWDSAFFLLVSRVIDGAMQAWAVRLEAEGADTDWPRAGRSD